MSVASESLGLGTYRMRADNPVHREALCTALAHGWGVVDTAGNYGDGSAESLVGACLADAGGHDAVVWTKAGYISPSLARALGPELLARAARRISDDAYYSLDPAVIELSLDVSLDRLRLDHVDTLFLHNPEHALLGGDPGEAQREERVDEQLRAALEVCERLVRRGRAGSYGVSSSAVTREATPGAPPPGEADALRPTAALSLPRLLGLAAGVRPDHSLRHLQVPVNLVEREALAGPAPTVVELAHAHGIRVAAQRPLTARTVGGVARLVDGPPPAEVRAAGEAGEQALARVSSAVSARLADLGHPERAMSFPIMRFLRDAWADLPDVDLLDDILRRRWLPFLTTVFDPVPADVERDARTVHRSAAVLVRARLSVDAGDLRRRLADDGVVGRDDDRPLEELAVEWPLAAGVDTVLVGARRPEYVTRLSTSLRRQPPR